MQHIFRFLTDAEEQALLKKGGIRSYAPEEVIIALGATHNAIFVIKSGSAVVEIDSAGFPLELSHLGPGQICGEMSFVEDVPATARVVAGDKPVETYIIEGALIEPFLEKNPSLFGRFYKSLSEILSRRLRDTSALVGAVSDWEPR